MSLEDFPNVCEDCKFFAENPKFYDKDFRFLGQFDDDYCTRLNEFIGEDNIEECDFKEVKE